MKTLTSLSIFTLFYSFAFAQIGDIPFNAEPGMCYAKCQISSKPVEVIENYPIYTGTTPDEVDLETVDVTVKKSSIEWEQKGVGTNAVWCMIQVPPIIETLTLVKDTSQTSEYEMLTISYMDSGKVKNRMEWKEVVCNEKINSNLTMQIQEALYDEGYYRGKLHGRMNGTTKTALTAYQKDNGLPLGNLDKETMDVLNVRY